VSRRSHRHGDRGHARPFRLEAAHPAAASTPPGSIEAQAAPDRAATAFTARAPSPADDVARNPAPPAPGAPGIEPAAAGRPADIDPDARLTPLVRPPMPIGPIAAVPPAPVLPPAPVQPPGPVLQSPPALQPIASGAPVVEAAQPGEDRAMAENLSAVDPVRSGCTSPQLRRFIKSRAYIPMHELRRRFAINGPEDDVAAIDLDGTRLYVGLPEREGRLLGELLRGGDVGAELSHDPDTPIIVGVYPMRPVPRG
jgi:hypothetical protein